MKPVNGYLYDTITVWPKENYVSFNVSHQSTTANLKNVLVFTTNPGVPIMEAGVHLYL